LEGISEIVHCAAQTKISGAASAEGLAQLHGTNVSGALNLARQAASAGVRRYVFVSSIRVNGDASEICRPLTEKDAPDPRDAYAKSKLEAEEGLWAIAKSSGMELVIARPPLVYGQGMKSALGAAAAWTLRGLPLPLGSINNPRSFVALDNLVDLLAACIHNPAAADQTFLVSDGEDLSVTGLLRRLSQAAQRPSRLVPVSPAVLQFIASAAGAGLAARRLCAPLQVDISHTSQTLGWSPPVSVDAALRKFALGG
jgi:nucleoside-diphosphate-sugar epimerase